MKKELVFVALASSAVLALAACGDDNQTVKPASDASLDQSVTDTGTTTETGLGNETGDTGGETGVVSEAGDSGGDATDTGAQVPPPPPPTLGTQIDRMGRPAINTALDHTFDPNPMTQNMAKDAYNADNQPAHWATFIPEIRANLAIYDGLDTVCGNQAAYGALTNPDYLTLASVLAGDALWLNTASTTCMQYLGVEFNVLGVTNTDCGGRTLTENTIDVTYNALAGTLATNAATNGIKASASAPGTTFPYLAAAH
jgi:Domain of unknown function (DUF4331)